MLEDSEFERYLGEATERDEGYLEMNGLERRKAVVRWTQNGTAGLNFIRPLSFEQLAQWVVEQQAGRSIEECALRNLNSGCKRVGNICNDQRRPGNDGFSMQSEAQFWNAIASALWRIT